MKGSVDEARSNGKIFDVCGKWVRSVLNTWCRSSVERQIGSGIRRRTWSGVCGWIGNVVGSWIESAVRWRGMIRLVHAVGGHGWIVVVLCL
jgi:hypothetical protein